MTQPLPLLTYPPTPPIRAPIRLFGGDPCAVIKILVAKVQSSFVASTLWKQTATFTSEWERMRLFRYVDTCGEEKNEKRMGQPMQI
ncbi:hypothetical protein NBRC116601_21100 [Cognatishimia sp. WU-CL00825]